MNNIRVAANAVRLLLAVVVMAAVPVAVPNAAAAATAVATSGPVYIS